MAFSKQMVRDYLGQLDLIDALDKKRTKAYCEGRFDTYHDIGHAIHSETKILTGLRNRLAEAVK